MKALADKETRMKLRTIGNMRFDARDAERKMKKLVMGASQLYADIAKKFGLQPMDEYILLEAVDNEQLMKDLRKQVNGG